MKAILLIFLLTVPFLGASQENILPGLIKTIPKGNHTQIAPELTRFLEIQQAKSETAKNETAFLRSLVKDSHRTFLKSYKAYSEFNELFENGQYDCLTGTAFFSLVLQSLHFDYKIIETNYHIFLMIETTNGNVLLETTDRLFGLKTKTRDIERCLNEYKENTLITASSGQQHYYQYQASLFHEIKPEQLEGLLYFNQAVVAYNNHEWSKCVDRLEKARTIYNNPRVEELTKILASFIALSTLNDQVKKELLIHLSLRVTDQPALAGR